MNNCEIKVQYREGKIAMKSYVEISQKYPEIFSNLPRVKFPFLFVTLFSSCITLYQIGEYN